MISGPTVPHPRLLLADLLRNRGGIDRLGGPESHFLESGLVFLEEDVEFGEGLRVDFLARDGAGAPVLILAVEGDEEAADVPLQLLDLDLWFRENAVLLRQGLGLLETAPMGLRWDLPHRIFLVTRGLRAARLKRLEGLGSLPLQVFELSFLALRGKRQWYTRLLPAWQPGSDGSIPVTPDGLCDPRQSALIGQFLVRLADLSPAMETHGDRFHRRIHFEGSPCVEVLCTDREARLHIDGQPAALVLMSMDDVEAALDLVLRLLLDRQAVAEGYALLGQVQDEEAAQDEDAAARVAPPGGDGPAPRHAEAQPDQDTSAHEPNGRLPARAVGRLRLGATARGKLPEARDLGPKLTDEEIDAFLKP